MRRSASVASAALVAGGVIAVAAAYAEPRVLAADERQTSVDALDGTVVWSSYRSGRYVLVAAREGRVSPLPVRSRGIPFDVDLGRDTGGRLIAVYSRCRREPALSIPAVVVKVDYTTGDGCRVYAYDFVRRRERLLRRPGARGRSGYLPSVWDRRIAWFETDDRRDRFARGSVLVTDTLRGGQRQRLATLADDDRPTDIDLRGRRVAYTTLRTGERCEDGSGDPGAGLEPLVDVDLRVQSVNGSGRRLVERGCSGDEARYLYSPAFVGPGELFYYLDRDGDSPLVAGRGVSSGARRWSLPGPAYREAPVPAAAVSAAEDGGRIVWVEPMSRRYRVLEDSAPQYRPASPAARRVGGGRAT